MAKELIPVLYDTQEQKPWLLDPTVFQMTKVKLPTGDYTIAGLDAAQLCIERKSLGDFVTSVTHEWIVHRKRWYRMAGFDLAAVVVEANIEDVLARRYESETDPRSVLGRANAIFIDHSVPVLFWGGRTACVTMAELFLAQAWKKLLRGRHE